MNEVVKYDKISNLTISKGMLRLHSASVLRLRSISKSRRDDTLLTVDFNLRTRDRDRSHQSPEWDDTLLRLRSVSNLKQNTL